MWDLADVLQIEAMWAAQNLFALCLTLVTVSSILVMVFSTKLYRIWEYCSCCKNSRKAKSCAHTMGRMAYKVLFIIVLCMTFAAIILTILLSYITVMFTVIFIILHSTCINSKETVQSYIEMWSG